MDPNAQNDYERFSRFIFFLLICRQNYQQIAYHITVQGATSEALLVVLLAARDKVLREVGKDALGSNKGTDYEALRDYWRHERLVFPKFFSRRRVIFGPQVLKKAISLAATD
ncbi:hypothetical protein L6452_09404 [Arctium lappa]|uniref:Uncharacterized protein n=1 Tax=Arctium lappa TaxID=4217 RepID=A0ACB9DK84_ARCLA|nr:hypothetical protein L6452_09404 [Arctium lappa]